MRKNLSLLLVATMLLSVVSHAQINFNYRSVKGNGQITEKSYPLENFTRVGVSSGMDIYLSPTGKQEVVIVTDANIQDEIIVEQREGKLYFKTKANSLRPTKGVKIYLSYKILNGISASGGSDVYMADDFVLRTDRLSLSGSGGSDFKLSLDVDELDCNLSGGSDADLYGNAFRAKYSVSGGSDVSARQLTSENVLINASGGSDVTVSPSKSIRASASGASDVIYYGNPENTSFSSSGGSGIRRK